MRKLQGNLKSILTKSEKILHKNCEKFFEKLMKFSSYIWDNAKNIARNNHSYSSWEKIV